MMAFPTQGYGNMNLVGVTNPYQSVQQGTMQGLEGLARAVGFEFDALNDRTEDAFRRLALATQSDLIDMEDRLTPYPSDDVPEDTVQSLVGGFGEKRVYTDGTVLRTFEKLMDVDEDVQWVERLSSPIEALTQGSILFVSSTGQMIQDNTNFFWDDTNNRLGIGNITPANSLHTYVNDTSAATSMDGSQHIIEQDSTGDAGIQLELTGTQAWSMLIDNSDSDKLVFYDITGTNAALKLDISTGDATFSGTVLATSLTLSGDLTIYEATNDGNPEIRIGSADAEEAHIQAVYDSGVQTLDYLLIQTDAASGTANKGLVRINVDGTDILDIDDGGIDLDTGKALSIAGTDVLTNNTLGSGVTASSLTSLGTQAEDLVMGDNSVTGVDTITFTDISGTIAGVINANLIDKSATETVSGVWTFSGSTTQVNDLLVSGSNVGTPADPDLLTLATNKVTLTSGGGSGISAYSYANELIVDAATHGGISVLVPDGSYPYIVMGDSTDNTAMLMQWQSAYSIGNVGTYHSGAQLRLKSGNGSTAIYLSSSQDVSIGTSLTSAKLRVDQSSSSGAKPVLYLDQADKDHEFIEFVGYATSGNLDRSVVDVDDVSTATIQGYLMISVEEKGNRITDQDYFIPIYTLA